MIATKAAGHKEFTKTPAFNNLGGFLTAEYVIMTIISFVYHCACAPKCFGTQLCLHDLTGSRQYGVFLWGKP